ncbi:MAG TPA: AAA domain-containing protein [Candidatus Angelobacter sp.]|nr:AAA domain-containing protein [Candidatus Angelobacter sp.]
MSTTPTRAPSSPNISAQRQLLVNQARQSWIKKLIDLSRRNNLLYFRPLKRGTLDLATADRQILAAFLLGEEISVKKLLLDDSEASLFAEHSEGSAVNCVREIYRRAMANLEEKGLQTLFVAIGKATWPATDGGRPAEAPILLVPALLETRGHQNFQLKRNGAVQANLVLLHVFEQQFGAKLVPEELVAKLLGDDEGEPFDPNPVYAEIRAKCAAVPGLEIREFAVLGNFAFQKMAMVKDLQQREQELAAHDIVAAIAGDSDARNSVSAAQQNETEPAELDRIPPENEFNVLDADSSQQCAIANVLAGQNAVVHGPPGTGKSQTITNLIAGLAAMGKRVLFVAEKRAALDVVLHRLDEAGLSHLAIDLHGADLSPKKVMQHVAHTLEMVRNSTPVECAVVHQQLVDRRARLNNHVQRLHEPRPPANKSVFEMEGTLLRLPVQSVTRWRGAELERLDPKAVRQIHDLLTEARGFSSLFLRDDPSPWCGANLPDGKSIQQALDLVSRIDRERWPNFLGSLNAVISQTQLCRPSSIKNVRELSDLLSGVQGTLATYSPDLYKENLTSLLNDLAAGKEGGISAAWALCTNPKFRNARSRVLKLRIKEKAPSARVFAEVTKAAGEYEKWSDKSQGASQPIPVAGMDQLLRKFECLLRDLESLAPILSKPIDDLSLDDCSTLVQKLAADSSTPYEIPRLTEIEKQLETAGAGKLIAELRERKPEPGSWTNIFEHAWLGSALDAVSQQDSEIRGFKGQTHTGYVDDFVRLDEERLAIAADRVRRAHGLNAIAVMNAHPDQQQLIKAEASKSRKHLPLRKVFAQAAEVLTAVCPCWMASPLSVSQLLDGGKQYFDFVVFDEASQVLPEDAVPAMLRGRGIVVAGDNKQLPPTTFFAATDEDDDYAAEEETSAAGFESLLDMMVPFVRSRYLDWHYRSRDESLISFSNHYLYQDRLVTFPGPGGLPAIEHILVDQVPGVDGQEESSNAEVRRVIELILDHARKRPGETLGVITMGIRHMDRVQAALDRELEKHQDLHAYFDPNVRERFFVKNLERVQGDERDAIIISIGYGKDRGGSLPLRFGPLLAEAGRRRLNVAITRARQRLTVVSSFSHLDIDVSRIRQGSGVELLRNYLQYAASNGKRLGDEQLTSVPLNGFEADIFDVLSGQGIKLVPQIGASQYRIDMVAQHPQKPGRFVLAIECDGATYHSSYSARDRDRLRQQQLENLGWRFHRIWSTDWFLRREGEVKRAMAAFAEAVKFADKVDADPSTASGGSNGNNRAHNIDHSPQNASQTQPRKIKPAIPLKPSIAHYSVRELAELINWINSDGQLRTDEEIITEMVSVLGFARRGTRIELALRNAIPFARSK